MQADHSNGASYSNPHNTSMAHTFSEKLMMQADHSNGALYSNPHNTSMRLPSQAAKQLASNTRLDGVEDLHNFGGRGRDGGRSSGGFCAAEMDEAIRLSLQSKQNVAASNLSFASRPRGFAFSDTNEATKRSLEQEYPNHSRDSFFLGSTFHQNSNMSSALFTESPEDTSPKNCRTLMLDAIIDSDLDDEDT